MQPVPPIFATWRAEIEIELAAARERLTSAIAESSAAQEAAGIAKAERHALADALARLGRNTSLATALQHRQRRRDDELRQQDRTVMARQTVESARRLIADLEEALTQLDQIAPQPVLVEEPAELAA